MLLICFSIDDHVISYTSDTWHTKKNSITFSLEHILCNDGTHWKPCPLEMSNV